jgi:hypothetical protein
MLPKIGYFLIDKRKSGSITKRKRKVKKKSTPSQPPKKIKKKYVRPFRYENIDNEVVDTYIQVCSKTIHLSVFIFLLI